MRYIIQNFLLHVITVKFVTGSAPMNRNRGCIASPPSAEGTLLYIGSKISYRLCFHIKICRSELETSDTSRPPNEVSTWILWIPAFKCWWGHRRSRRSPPSTDASTISWPPTPKRPRCWRGSSCTRWTWRWCGLRCGSTRTPGQKPRGAQTPSGGERPGYGGARTPARREPRSDRTGRRRDNHTHTHTHREVDPTVRQTDWLINYNQL